MKHENMKHSKPFVSMRKLERLLELDRKKIHDLASTAGRYYSPFDVRKPSGGWRHVDNPTGPLKACQRLINKRILRPILEQPEFQATALIGGVRGRSVIDNAVHVGHPVVACIDLKDCFPRTKHHAVYQAFSERAGCSPRISSILTKLTTFQRRLPVGARTSSSLLNLVLWDLHDHMKARVSRCDGNITVFVDDITISGDYRIVPMVEELIQMVHQKGYSIRNKKLRIMPSHTSQETTGLRVNRVLSVPRPYRKHVRGRVRAMQSGILIDPSTLRSVKGKVGHVRRINGNHAVGLAEGVSSIPEPPEFYSRRGTVVSPERRPCRRACRHENE